MRFTFTVEVEVERTQGKFATREELAQQIIDELDGCNPGQLEGENGGEYEISDWSVSEAVEVKEPKVKKAAKVAAVAPAPVEPGALDRTYECGHSHSSAAYAAVCLKRKVALSIEVMARALAEVTT